MVLETVFETEDGGVALIDFMPIDRDANSSVIRIVEGRRGQSARCGLHMMLRFDYGPRFPG